MKNNVLLTVLSILLGVAILVFVVFKVKDSENHWITEGWGNTPPLTISPDQQKFDSYRGALEVARRENKLVFLYFESDSCSWCRKMQVNTLSKPSVRKALRPFVVYYVNCNKERNLAQKYNVQSVPAYCMITPNETVVKAGQGYKGEVAFLGWLKMPKLIK